MGLKSLNKTFLSYEKVPFAKGTFLSVYSYTARTVAGLKGSETPRPKTISARNSSAKIDFFTGTPRPGTPRPSYRNASFVSYNGRQMFI